MPGPNSQPYREDDRGNVVASGKTAVDYYTGKHARHLRNQAAKADANRSSGSKR